MVLICGNLLYTKMGPLNSHSRPPPVLACLWAFRMPTSSASEQTAAGGLLVRNGASQYFSKKMKSRVIDGSMHPSVQNTTACQHSTKKVEKFAKKNRQAGFCTFGRPAAFGKKFSGEVFEVGLKLKFRSWRSVLSKFRQNRSYPRVLLTPSKFDELLPSWSIFWTR